MYSSNQPMVALTFDDGPMGNEGAANAILETLATYQLHATFFYCGMNMNAETILEIERAHKAGHEIGNHTTHHPDLTLLSENKMLQEVETTATRLQEITGLTEFLVRPPYLNYNQKLLDLIPAPLIGASVDSRDWAGIEADAIINNVLTQVHDGAIILMHENQIHTAKAIGTLVPRLLQMGYQMVTVSQLMKAKGCTLLPGKYYNEALS